MSHEKFTGMIENTKESNKIAMYLCDSSKREMNAFISLWYLRGACLFIRLKLFFHQYMVRSHFPLQCLLAVSRFPAPVFGFMRCPIIIVPKF